MCCQNVDGMGFRLFGHRVIQSANTTLVLSGIARCICPFRKCKNQCNFTAYNPGFPDPHPYPVSSVWSKGA